MKRAAHRPGLDEATLGERAADLARLRLLAPDADSELGRRCHLRLDTAEAADHPDDRHPTDRIEQLPLHPPRERLSPTDLQCRTASVPWPSACHARARTAAETDRTRIVALYHALAQLVPSPVVELNRAVACSRAVR